MKPIDWKPEYGTETTSEDYVRRDVAQIDALRQIAEELYLLRRHFMVIETEMMTAKNFGPQAYKDIDDLDERSSGEK